jgi:hypothetical protein
VAKGTWISRRLGVLLGILLVTLVPPGTALGEDFKAGSEYGPGFLHIRPQAPGHSFRMTMPHILPGSIRPGVGYVLGATLSNIWILDNVANLDYEMLDYHLSVTYGLSEKVGFAVFYDSREYFGGVLDGLVQEFHDMFGMGQDGRTDVAKGRTWFERFDTGYIADDLTVLNNRALSFLVQYVFLFGKEGLPAAGVSTGLRYALETPEGEGPAHPVDCTLALGLAKRLSESLYSCLHLGYTHFEQDRILELDFKKDVLTGMLALAWSLQDHWAIIAQYFSNDGIIEDFSQFSEPSHELDVGLKVGAAGGTFEFAVIENIFTFDNGPDLGFHFAYSRQL